VNSEDLNSTQTSDPTLLPTVRLKWQLSALALGLPLSLLLGRFAWESHRSYNKTIALVLSYAPIFLLFAARRRLFHPDLPSSRWTEDSVSYKRFKGLGPLRWLASGAFILASLGLILSPFVFDFIWHPTTRHLWEWFFFLIAYSYISAAYVIWRQYCEDRRPLAPSSPGNPNHPQNVYERLDRWEGRLFTNSLQDSIAESAAPICLNLIGMIKPLTSTIGASQPKS
jgi:hypothetical protein